MKTPSNRYLDRIARRAIREKQRGYMLINPYAFGAPSLPPPAWSGRAYTRSSGGISNPTIPSGSVGDLLIAVCYYSMGSNALQPHQSAPTWNKIWCMGVDQQRGMLIFAKLATGSDGLSISSSGSHAAATVVYRFPTAGLNYNIIPSWEAEVGTTGTSADPPSKTVLEAASYLWLAFVGAGHTGGQLSPEVTGYPSGWTNTGSSWTSSVSNTGTIGSAELTSAVLTQDPGAFTLGASSPFQTLTAAVISIPASIATPTYVGSGTAGYGFGDATATIPGGVVAGDLLIGQVTKNVDAASSVNTGTSGSGWIRLPWSSRVGGSNEFYYKITTGSDASLRLTTTQWTAVQVHAIRNASPERMLMSNYDWPGSTTPSSLELTPISGSRTYLAMAYANHTNTSASRTAIPSGYSNGNTPGSNGNIGSPHAAWKTFTGSTVSDAQWTFSASTGLRGGGHILFWGPYT